MYGPYPARVVDVHDGDTVHLDIDLGFGFQLHAYDLNNKPVLSCRVYGINAPELSTPEGKAALAYAQTILLPGDAVTVTSRGWDKYGGRFDGEIIMFGGESFGQAMISSGNAVAYS